jgi:nitroreductase/Pyruvate/2-oxoacid:ferredoxin oxidoreductase delta subunit
MIKIDNEKCIGCGMCVRDCFPGCIDMVDGKANLNKNHCIKCGHCIAVCPKSAVSIEEYDMADVKEYDRERFSLNAENLLNFVKFRRTIRHFKDKKVEDDKIRKILEAGRFTETASNAQDVSYTVIRDNIDKLKDLTFSSMAKIADEVLKSNTVEAKLYKRYAKLWLKMCEDYKRDNKKDSIFFNAPLVIAVTSEYDVDAALASSNMELEAEALGLGVLFSGFFIRAAADPEMRDFLEVGKRKKVSTCMIIGYPDVQYFRTVPRKKLDAVWK